MFLVVEPRIFGLRSTGHQDLQVRLGLQKRASMLPPLQRKAIGWGQARWNVAKGGTTENSTGPFKPLIGVVTSPWPQRESGLGSLLWYRENCSPKSFPQLPRLHKSERARLLIPWYHKSTCAAVCTKKCLGRVVGARAYGAWFESVWACKIESSWSLCRLVRLKP